MFVGITVVKLLIKQKCDEYYVAISGVLNLTLNLQLDWQYVDISGVLK